jgi:hypothetical protein
MELKMALEDWDTPLEWTSKKSIKLKDGRLIRIISRVEIADRDFTPEIPRPGVSRAQARSFFPASQSVVNQLPRFRQSGEDS